MVLNVVLMLLLLSLPAWAATFHVRTGGNDTNSCTSAQTNTNAAAKQSIGNAIRNCGGAGQTIQVHAGQYDEAFDNNTFYRNGSSTSGTFPGGSSNSNRFVIEGAPTELVEIRPSQNYGGGVVFNNLVSWVTLRNLILDSRNQSGNPWKVTIPATHWTLEDVEVRNGANSGLAMGDDSASPNCNNSCFHEFLRVRSHDSCPGCTPSQKSFVHGAYVGCSDNTFTGGAYYGNGHGIQSYCDPGGTKPGSPDRNKFYGVSFYDNTSVGLGLYFGSDNEAINVLSYNNEGAGIWIAGLPAKAYGNTVTGNNGAGLSCYNYGLTADTKNNLSVANGGSEFEDCNNASGNGNIASNTTSDFFVAAAFGNYHIGPAFSPAINGGVNLPNVFPNNVDLEGFPRPSGSVTTGAFQYGGALPPPSPDIVALYHADGTANDSAGHPSGPFHGTLGGGMLANGASIVSGSSFVFDGVNDIVTVAGNTTLRPPSIGLSLWMNSTTHPAPGANCHAVAMGQAWAMGWFDSGQAFCWVNFGPTAYQATGTVLNGTNQMISCAYDPAASSPGVRLWVGNNPIAFTPTTGALVYSGSENLTIGNNMAGTSPCAGRIDEVTIANFAWTQSDIDALFLAVTPTAGKSMTHQRFTVANTGEGNWIGPEDTDQSIVVTQPWGLRWSLHNASGGDVVENFRPFCRINHSPGGWGAWTELTNSFGSFGLRYLTDTAVNVGDPTTPLLTLDSFTPVPGKFLADVVDLTSPYDTAQKITLATGQHAEQEIRVQAGSPVVAGDLIQCRPYHESGAVLSGGYGTGDVNVKTLTMLAVIAPATVRLGGVQSGGTFQ